MGLQLASLFTPHVSLYDGQWAESLSRLVDLSPMLDFDNLAQFFLIGPTILAFLRLPRSFCKRQPPINLAYRIDVALAVFDDLRQLPGAVVGVDF